MLKVYRISKLQTRPEEVDICSVFFLVWNILRLELDHDKLSRQTTIKCTDDGFLVRNTEESTENDKTNDGTRKDRTRLVSVVVVVAIQGIAQQKEIPPRVHPFSQSLAEQLSSNPFPIWNWPFRLLLFKNQKSTNSTAPTYLLKRKTTTT